MEKSPLDMMIEDAAIIDKLGFTGGSVDLTDPNVQARASRKAAMQFLPYKSMYQQKSDLYSPSPDEQFKQESAKHAEILDQVFKSLGAAGSAEKIREIMLKYRQLASTMRHQQAQRDLALSQLEQAKQEREDARQQRMFEYIDQAMARAFQASGDPYAMQNAPAGTVDFGDQSLMPQLGGVMQSLARLSNAMSYRDKQKEREEAGRPKLTKDEPKPVEAKVEPVVEDEFVGPPLPDSTLKLTPEELAKLDEELKKKYGEEEGDLAKARALRKRAGILPAISGDQSQVKKEAEARNKRLQREVEGKVVEIMNSDMSEKEKLAAVAALNASSGLGMIGNALRTADASIKQSPFYKYNPAFIMTDPKLQMEYLSKIPGMFGSAVESSVDRQVRAQEERAKLYPMTKNQLKAEIRSSGDDTFLFGKKLEQMTKPDLIRLKLELDSRRRERREKSKLPVQMPLFSKFDEEGFRRAAKEIGVPDEAIERMVAEEKNRKPFMQETGPSLRAR
jgi:hypothetical protein